jgi:2Fe-2S iron-sulfur cluster binding domain
MPDLRVQPQYEIAGVERGEAFEFYFEGQPVQAYPGETIGAALTAAGITTFRTTRKSGKPRGIFCGIGICYDCLVVVDDTPNRRACLTPARPSADVRIQPGVAADFF